MSAHDTAEPGRPSIAIVGSGPSGCYTAQFLRKALPSAAITVFEALPVPYGLVRYGVAADHQGTKAVAQQFDRLFLRGGISFVGNTRIGADVGFDRIADAFDAVVVATGLPDDRPLPVPVDAGARVFGAGRILRALNAFPSGAAPGTAQREERLGDELIVVGHGNVAIDVVRLLTKRADHLVGSDIDDRALAALRPSPPTRIRVVGRSAAAEAKFDVAMVRELSSLDCVLLQAEGIEAAACGPIPDLLREAANQQKGKGKSASAGTTTVVFQFETSPTRVRVSEGHTVLDVVGPSREPSSFPADAVITAIGFGPAECQGSGHFPARPNVYRVGWLERGGKGNIAENRKHAQAVARTIVADLADGNGRGPEATGLAAIRPHLPAGAVGFEGWQAIDDHERRAAGPHRCRRKISDLDEMVAVATAATATG